MQWPDWWSWELELSPHLMKRMIDRDFNEVDLRLMLDGATGYHADKESGRFAIETTRDAQPWIVIVEPSDYEALLIVVTAYSIS